MKKLVLVLIWVVLFQSALAVPIEFSGTPGETPVTMTFLDNVSFTLTVGQSNQIGTLIWFLIEDVIDEPDAGQNGVDSSGNPDGFLELSINSSEWTLPCWDWFDHFGSSYNDITLHDSYFGYEGPPIDLFAGDVITLHAGSMVSAEIASTNFQLGVSGNYNMFIMSGFSTEGGAYTGRISENGVVPDDDDDGLSNGQEQQLGTNPDNPDSDEDKFDDAFEAGNGMNPLVADTWILPYITNHVADFGIDLASSVIDVAVGEMLLEATGGVARLSLQLEKSDDLVTWAHAGNPVIWSTPVGDNKLFFRVRSTEAP